MTNSNNKVPNLDSTGKRLRDSLAEEDQRFEARKEQLAVSAPKESLILPDAAAGSQFAHTDQTQADKNKHFSQKIYFFPPEFHALREELENNYRDFFTEINPLTGTSPAYCMVYDAPQFIGYCNGMTGLAEQLDTGNVAGTCKTFLNAFRRMRGVKGIE